MMMWMLMACSGGEDTSEEVACGVLDTIAVATYETDADGQIWLDARGSTACDEALYSWWESSSATPDGSDILVDDDINSSTEAVYVPLDMEEWAGKEVTFLLTICVEPLDAICWNNDDRLGADEISFSVPE
ncbi:MAG: hypothetical protein ACI8RZ_000782 [Myxococcota bacterium]|jgi:hypothetical protein